MKTKAISVAICVFILALCIARPAVPQVENISLNFRDADIKAVIEAVGKLTGKIFILDPRVKGKVNIISARPAPSALVYEIFLSALRLQGFTAVEHGEVVTILPNMEGAKSRSPVFGANLGVSGERIVTQVYPLLHESASQLVTVIKPLLNKNSSITAYPLANIIVITDVASNIKRIDKIIRAIDKPVSGKVEIIYLRHISVFDFAHIVRKILLARGGASLKMPGATKAGSGSERRFSMVTDGRTNSLVIRGENPDLLRKVRKLAERLDVDIGVQGNTHVVSLNYADPKSMVKILNGVLVSQSSLEKSAGPKSPTPPMMGAAVQADEETKSIIIVAPDHIYKILRSVIDKLDTRRRQVYIEALIVEVTSDKVAEFGIQWQSLRGLDANSAPRTLGVGGVNLGGTGNTIAEQTINTAGNVPLGGGLNVGVVNGTITLPNGTVVPNLLALARALETDVNANILSTPTLLVLDNKEAKILVGQNVPFITGSYAPSTGGATGSVNPFQTIERRDIGISLKVKPRITESNTIQLTIYKEVSSLLSVTVNTGASDVVTNKRSLDSTVLVDDGQIIVLGGLVKDEVSFSEEKVPFLGDIPILGSLFRYDKRKQSKTNLLVFLRPRILRTAEDSFPITMESYNFAREKQEGVRPYPNLLMPEMNAPVAPAFQQHKKNKAPDTTGSKPESSNAGDEGSFDADSDENEEDAW